MTTKPEYKRLRRLYGSIITLEGLIGAGKSTLGRSLEIYLNSLGIKAIFFPEYVNTILLNQYISDMNKYSYMFQLVMLLKRIEVYKEAVRYSDKGYVVIIDRSLIGDFTFANMQLQNGNISQDEWDTYMSILQEDKDRIEPNYNIFLECSPEIAFNRMNSRGIKSEMDGYTLDYFNKLHKCYTDVMNTITHNMVYIDWSSDVKVVEELISDDVCYNILQKLN